MENGPSGFASQYDPFGIDWTVKGTSRGCNEVEIRNNHIEQDGRKSILRGKSVLKSKCVGSAVLAELLDQWSGIRRTCPALFCQFIIQRIAINCIVDLQPCSSCDVKKNIISWSICLDLLELLILGPIGLWSLAVFHIFSHSNPFS